jgi:hypothetical protein
MDFTTTNNSTTSSWGDRRNPNDGNQSGAYGNPVGKPIGVAYEWQIDLVNTKGKDPWFNIPHPAGLPAYNSSGQRTGNGHVGEFARLVKRNLAGGRWFYIELSNEVWNGGFSTTQNWFANYYDQKGLTGATLGQPGTTAHKAVIALGWKSAKVFQEFNSVFSGETGRLRKVISGQAANVWYIDQAWKGYNQGGQGGVVTIACAPYFGYDVNGNAGDARSKLEADIRNLSVPRATNHRNNANGKGVALSLYEAGQHMRTGARAASEQAWMENVYYYYRDKVGPQVNGVFALFNHAMGGDNQQWGLKEYIGEPAKSAPKWRAAVNY